MGLQLQVQLVPFMQVFVRMDRSYQGQMCGEAPMRLSVGLLDWGGTVGVGPALALGCEMRSGVKDGWEALALGLGGKPSSTQHT